MHSKTSIDTIRNLRRELKLAKDEIDASQFTALINALNKGEKLYSQIGGSIFASGIICGEIITDDIATKDGLHWHSRHYAPISKVSLIKPPIHIDEFRDFITISRTGAITKLTAEQEVELIGLRA